MATRDPGRRLLLRTGLLHFESATDFDAATRIYRRCRSAGVTRRGMIDCMIGTVPWRCGAALSSYDSDLERVAQVIGVDMDEASLRS